MTLKNRMCSACALLATLLVSPVAQAQIFRAYVASDGTLFVEIPK